MPLKNIQRNNFGGAMGLPVHAIIKKGDTKKNSNGVEYPTNLDYFRPLWRVAESNIPRMQQAWNDLFGEQADSLNNLYIACAIPDPTFDQLIPMWMEEWKKTYLVRRCDGETITRENNAAGERTDTTPRPCISFIGGACDCKPTMYLAFYSPEFCRMTNSDGVFRLILKSWDEAQALQPYLQSVYNRLEGTGYSMTDVPFTVFRTDVEMTMPTDDGKRKKITHNMVRLNAQIADYTTQQLVSGDAPALESGIIVDEDGVIESDGQWIIYDPNQHNKPAKYEHNGTMVFEFTIDGQTVYVGKRDYPLVFDMVDHFLMNKEVFNMRLDPDQPKVVVDVEDNSGKQPF